MQFRSSHWPRFQGLVWLVQVLESASRTSLWSDADDDPLEAVAMFLKGIDETCSSECTLSQHQVCATYFLAL